MMTLHWSSRFKRSFKKYSQNNLSNKEKILKTMESLSLGPFNPQLKSRKLKGVLEGSWACSVDYNLRIVFEMMKNRVTNQEEILLIDIGTHEEVY